MIHFDVDDNYHQTVNQIGEMKSQKEKLLWVAIWIYNAWPKQKFPHSKASKHLHCLGLQRGFQCLTPIKNLTNRKVIRNNRTQPTQQTLLHVVRLRSRIVNFNVNEYWMAYESSLLYYP